MSENIHVELRDECYNCFNDGKTKIGKNSLLLVFSFVFHTLIY